MTPFDRASLSLSGSELPLPTVGGSPFTSGGHVARVSGDGGSVDCASETFVAATATNTAMIGTPRPQSNSSRLCECINNLQVYKRAVRFCRPRLMVLKIMPNGFVKFTTKGPNTLCATPTFEPGPKSGGVVTAACGADDNSSPVRRVEHYVYPMTDDRLGVRVIH
jgi:hypothetical protein